MTSHIVIAAYLCDATCQPQQLRVWDGDSFLISMIRGSERERVLGLDTAEIKGKCSNEIQTASEFRYSGTARTSTAGLLLEFSSIAKT